MFLEEFDGIFVFLPGLGGIGCFFAEFGDTGG